MQGKEPQRPRGSRAGNSWWECRRGARDGAVRLAVALAALRFRSSRSRPLWLVLSVLLSTVRAPKTLVLVSKGKIEWQLSEMTV